MHTEESSFSSHLRHNETLVTLDIMKLKQLGKLTFEKYEKAEDGKHAKFQEAITFVNLTRGK